MPEQDFVTPEIYTEFGSLLYTSQSHILCTDTFITIVCILVCSSHVANFKLPVQGPALPTNSSVAVFRTNRYTEYRRMSTGDSIGDQTPPAQVIAAIEYGLGSGTSFLGNGFDPLYPNCPSGYCDFDVYQTLGVHSWCQDISDKIENATGYYYLPANDGLKHPLWITNNKASINTTTSALYPDSKWFANAQDVGPLISNTFIISGGFYGRNPPYAIECVLYWAVYTLNSTMRASSWGEVLDNRTGSYFWTNNVNHTTYKQNTSIVIQPPTCFVNGSEYANHSNPAI
jgi:hypothetical protein